MPAYYHQCPSPKRVAHQQTFEKQSRTTKQVTNLSPVVVSQLSMIGRIRPHSSQQQQQQPTTPPLPSSPLLFTPSSAPRPHPHPQSPHSPHTLPHHHVSHHQPPHQQKPVYIPGRGSSALYDPRDTITLPSPPHHQSQNLHPSAWSRPSPVHSHDDHDSDSDHTLDSDSEDSSFDSFSLLQTPPARPSSPCPWTLAPCLKTLIR
ncbi:hypothetical protein QCA50_013343 [Cerrena zonata]|uniref:Uncharacterized protein n=1 Tax=Cerrena zonata TaxID=2478898 RepID=A0AAW0FWN5_9APHY